MLGSVDPDSGEIAKGTLYGLVSRVAAIAIVLACNVLLARILGAEQAGLYYLGVAVISVLAVISLLGIDNGSIRHAANMVADGRWADLASLYRRAVKIVILSSAIWATLIFFTADGVASRIFLKPEVAEPLRWISLALPFFALLWLTSRFLQSASRAASSLFFQSASIPAVLILLLMLPVQWNATAAAVGYDLAAALALLLCVLAWYRSVPIAGEKNPHFDMSAVLQSSRLLLPANLVNKVIRPWTAVVCLGIWGSLVEVAWYSVAMRVAALVSFAVLPVNTILAPKVAVLAQRKELSKMYRLAMRATLLIVAIAFPILALVTLAPDLIMSMFGSEFAGAATILSILVVGQVINVLTGPVQSLLVMTGNEHLNKQASFAGGIAILVLSAVLIPTKGAAGAAWATVGAIAVTNLLSAAMVWRLWRRSN